MLKKGTDEKGYMRKETLLSGRRKRANEKANVLILDGNSEHVAHA